ncbi:MAG: hypothetical protein K6G80_06360 [Treponema sp.]|nr:hypothetical protein [Treponema sp.]
MEIELAEIPQLVREHKLPLEKAVQEVWVHMYMRPVYFGLGDFSEDDKSDFLLSLQSTLPKIITQYDPQRGAFKTFLHHYIQNNIKNWRRKQRGKAHQGTILGQILSPEFDNESPDSAIEQTGKTMEFYKKRKKSKNLEIAKRTTLILCLRSCTAVTGELLVRIAAFLEIPPQTLEQMLQDINSKREAQHKKRDKLIEARNVEFYKHLKYAHLLQNKSYLPETQNKLLRQYNRHTRRWNYYNKRLMSRMLHCPSSDMIAKELGIETRKVYFYINHAINKRKVHWEIINPEHKTDGREE